MNRLPRKSSVLAALAISDAPRVFSPSSLQDWLATRQLVIPSRTLSLALIEWSQAGVMERVNSRVYLNNRARPKPTAEEATPYLRPGAVVSLEHTLSHVGILNKPSPQITAVVSSSDTTKVGRVQTDVGVFRFAALPENMIIRADHVLFHDAIDRDRPWMATPEKALLDWLHLASTPHGMASWPLPAAYDWNMHLLDTDRLHRLAPALGMEGLLLEFTGKIDLGALDPTPRRTRRLR
jgi:hypothetical protein